MPEHRLGFKVAVAVIPPFVILAGLGLWIFLMPPAAAPLQNRTNLPTEAAHREAGKTSSATLEGNDANSSDEVSTEDAVASEFTVAGTVRFPSGEPAPGTWVRLAAVASMDDREGDVQESWELRDPGCVLRLRRASRRA